MDIECTDEDTSDVVNAFHHAVKRIFTDDIDTKIMGQCTKSGGGGTGEYLRKEL